MELIQKLKAFFNLSELISRHDKYNVEKFQEDLLYFNKVIRKTYFKYDNPTFSLNEIYQDSLKEIKVEVKFTMGKGSVEYIFKDFSNNELATISTNGQTHKISMSNVELLNKDQINTLFETLELNKIFNKITNLCNEEAVKQKVIKEDKLVNQITDDKSQLNFSDEVVNYKKNNDIYFNIINLSIDKTLREHKLNLSGDKFLNFDLKNSKNMLILVEDININLKEFKSDSIELKLNGEKYIPYFDDGDDAFAYRNINFTFSKNGGKFLEMMVTYHQDELLNNQNKHNGAEVRFSVINNKETVEVENDVNKHKLLDFIQVFPLLEDTLTLLQQENFKLDKLIDEKEKKLKENINLSSNIIEEKIHTLKNKLNSKM